MDRDVEALETNSSMMLAEHDCTMRGGRIVDSETESHKLLHSSPHAIIAHSLSAILNY